MAGMSDDDLTTAYMLGLHSAHRWIPVSERLPPDNVSVLVNHQDGGVEMAFRERGLRCISWTNYPHSGSGYTHWQHLPAPPEVE